MVAIATVAGSSLQYWDEADVVVQHLAEKYRSAFETKDSVPEVYQLPSWRPRKSSHADLQMGVSVGGSSDDLAEKNGCSASL